MMNSIGSRGTITFALVSYFLVVYAPAIGGAADIGWDYDANSPATRLTIYISGTIEPGDLAKMQDVYAQIELLESDPDRYKIIDEDEFEDWQEQWKAEREGRTTADIVETPSHKSARPTGPLRTIFRLNSPGGDLSEALNIGRWIRQQSGTVAVSPSSRCASACVFLLAAGVYKYALGQMLIHRPYFSQMPDGDVGAQFRTLLHEVRGYLSEMNIPEGLADEMFSIRPEDGVLLSRDALSRYRLNMPDIGEQEKNELRQAERLGISRAELMRRRQTYNQAIELGACEEFYDDRTIAEWGECISQLELMHGLKRGR